MKVGCGYSNERSSFESGATATENALKNGGLTSPDLLLAFCSGGLEPKDFLKGVQSIVGNTPPIVGGSSIGIITNEHLSYNGYSAGVAAFQLDSIPFQVSSAGGLAKDTRGAGKKLVENFSVPSEAGILLIFYDSLESPAKDDIPPVLIASSPLIEGIESGLRKNIPVFGGGLLGDFHFKEIPRQFCGDFVGRDCVVGILSSGGLKPYFKIMHGCSPLDGVYHQITKSEGPVIYEIDHQPVVEMIDSIYGNGEWRQKHPIDLLTIGVNCGNRFETPSEANYVNRLITGALPDGSGIGIFEADLPSGTEIQFMLRDSEKMIQSAAENSAALMRQIVQDGRNARFGFYIDCAGRTAALSNTMSEEAAEVQKVFNQYDIPLLGFYSGVEIAPFLDKSRGLDWTGVLIVFTE